MSKRLWVLPIMVVLLVVGVAGLAQAMPSLAGPTGVVATPTAEIAPQDLLSVVLTRQSIEAGGDDLANWELHALGSIASRAELWLTYQTISNSFDSQLWGLGGKVQVYESPQSVITAAVGAGWLQWQDGLLNWAAGLPLAGKVKWADSTPAEVRDKVRHVLGLAIPTPPPHTLRVTASANPEALPASGGTVELSATAHDNEGHGVATWRWTASPSSAGVFSNPSLQNPTFTVNALTSGSGRTITFTVTATSSAADSLQAHDTVAVTQGVNGHVLEVTATAAPMSVPADGGAVNLDASFTDNMDGTVESWSWSVTPADAGKFSQGQNTQHAIFMVDPSGPSYPDEHDITFTVTAISALDGMEAQADVTVTEKGSEHRLTVTATCTPTMVTQDGGRVQLSASADDSWDVAIGTWQWSVSTDSATNPYPGSFETASDQQIASFLVSAFDSYNGDYRTITFTVTATSAQDGLSASNWNECKVIQTYTGPGMSTISPAVTRSLASAPTPGKSAFANLAAAKQTLRDASLNTMGRVRLDDPFARVLSREDVSAWNAYAVGTLDLGALAARNYCQTTGTRLLGSLGVWYENASPSLGDSMSMIQPFLSFKALWSNGIGLAAEYRWADDELDADPVISALASYALDWGLAAEAGITNASPLGLGLEEYDWFVRLGYTFQLGGL